MGEKYVWTAATIMVIWIAVALSSIFSPDLVAGGNTGANVPVAAIICPFFGAIATLLVVLWGRRS